MRSLELLPCVLLLGLARITMAGNSELSHEDAGNNSEPPGSHRKALPSASQRIRELRWGVKAGQGSIDHDGNAERALGFLPIVYNTEGNEGNDEKGQTSENAPLDFESRIIGGQPAVAGDYPFYAHVIDGNLCGGTLVHKDIVLTAAHCLEAFDEGTIVIIGASQVDGGDATETIAADFAVPHPDYVPDTDERNDIMLVKLTSFSTAPLVTLNVVKSMPADNEAVKVIGFGLTVADDIDSISMVLNEVEVDAVNFDQCIIDLQGINLFPDTQICAGVTEGGKDSCQGDSGGPLLQISGDVQYGIVSLGVGW
jgi:trypsin